MNKKTKYDTYDDDETVTSLTLKNFIWGLVGILLGLVINESCHVFFDVTDILNPNIKMVIQLAVCALTISLIQLKINKEFAWSLEHVTPGLFFVSFFFGTQYLEYALLYEKYEG
jgi:hypothetical protein